MLEKAVQLSAFALGMTYLAGFIIDLVSYALGLAREFDGILSLTVRTLGAVFFSTFLIWIGKNRAAQPSGTTG